MNDRLEGMPSVAIGKDDRPQSSPIDPGLVSRGNPPRRQHVGTETVDELLPDARKIEHVVTDRIGIDHGAPRSAKQTTQPGSCRWRRPPSSPMTGAVPCFQRLDARLVRSLAWSHRGGAP